jgi:hypothetical protein
MKLAVIVPRMVVRIGVVAGLRGGTAAAAVRAEAAASTSPMVTIVMSRSEISAADEVIAGRVSSCRRMDKNIAPMDTMVLPWLAANAPRVHLTGSIETKPTDRVVSTTKPYWCAHYGESIAPSWTTLQSWAAKYEMRFISHSADYPLNWTTAPASWTGTLAGWQDYETCGSRDDITAHGLLGANGQFNWPSQVTDPTVMTNDVNQCFFMNRTYHGTGVNTLATVQADQNIASTQQLIGGSCNVVGLPCAAPLPDCSTCLYAVPRQIINQINALQPGQEMNLQAYVLVRNSNPDVNTGINQYKVNADRWDCTNPNPAYHWSNDAERYCWVDFQRIMRAIQGNPNVIVTDPQGVAVAWGMPAPVR